MITFVKKYFQVTTLQLTVMVLMSSIISSSLILINMLLMDYYQLPIVTYSKGVCVTVSNVRNGDKYMCEDVEVTLRKYRKN